MTLTRLEITSVAATFALGLISVGMAYSFQHSPFIFAGALGAFGGLFHEFFQSGGKVLFFSKKPDGMYLGSIAGMMMGAVAAMALAKGIGVDASGVIEDIQNLGYESFMAGVTIKGLTEAAAGEPVSSGVTPISGLPAPPAKV